MRHRGPNDAWASRVLASWILYQIHCCVVELEALVGYYLSYNVRVYTINRVFGTMDLY